LASLVSSVVWVLSLSADSVALSIRNGISLHTSIATVVQGLAINDLLLRKRKKFSRVEEVSSLNNSNSREGPAGSTVSLVLDLIDGSLLSPVNRGGDSSDEFWNFLIIGLIVGLGALSSSEDGLLGFGHIRELVVSHGEQSVLGVVFVDLSIDSGEVGKSEFVLLLGAIRLSVSGNVVDESHFSLEWDGSEGSSCKGNNGSGLLHR